MIFNKLAVAGLLTLLPNAWAGFSPSATNNIAVYWGQNSQGQATSQSRLSTYCSNTPVNIIYLAFLDVIKNPTTLNFANAGDNCTLFAGTELFSCPQIAADIQTCQSQGKTILLSIGGATYNEGGFTSSSEATQWANTIWAMFGPQQSGSSVNRPFGSAVVDGFDFDFESSTSNMAPFGSQLRSLMDASTAAGGKKYYLSAAPQCPYPDVADNDMLNGAVSFDWVAVQFYNNYCGLNSFVNGASTQNNFNFGTWDNWAKTVSKNKNVKVFIGAPGSSGSGGGYVSASQLANIISYSKQFSSFGGVMIWDMSTVTANSGFLSGVSSALGAGSNPPPPATTLTTITKTATTSVKTTTTTHAPTTTTSAPASSTGVAQWGQCGGNGYTGSTVCQSPYTCVEISEWWSQCE